jgi:hypothetical protein
MYWMMARSGLDRFRERTILLILQKLPLVVLDLLARSLYAVYWLLPYTLLSALPLLLAALIFGIPRVVRDGLAAPSAGGYWLPLAAVVLVVAYAISGRRRSDGNPHRIYHGFPGRLDERIDSLFAWIGTLKYFTSPLTIVEDPGSCKIRGDEIRELIDSILEPGDILLRGYDGYIDSMLISKTSDGEGLGKYFSHAALFIGDLNDARDKPLVARRLQAVGDSGSWVEATEAQKEEIRNSPAYYQAGRQKVIHSMTRGVFAEDILTFLRCDYLAVLRLANDSISYDAQDIENAGRTMLIPDLAGEARAIHDRLMNGETVAREEIIAALRHSALGKIGSCYDFQFNNIKAAHIFSCSEFVYYCYKSIHCHLGLLPRIHAFMKRFFPRETITPADIYQVATSRPAGQERLRVIWLSKALTQQGQPAR